jgi:hypothetical protein
MPKVLPAKNYKLFTGSVDKASGKLESETLSGVHNYLKRFEAITQPKDFRLPAIKHLFVDFKTPYLSAAWTAPALPTELSKYNKVIRPPGEKDYQGETFYFKKKGISDVQQQILPPSFFKGLKQLSVIDPAGADLATRVWSKFAQDKTQVRLVRTILTRLDNGSVVRVIRNCQSLAYAPYSHLRLVEDLLHQGQAYGKMPVLHWRLSDPGFRVRFACIDPTIYSLSAVDASILETEPIPVVEAWNSETGQRKVGIGAGVYLLRNGAFIGATGRLGKEEWIHKGNLGRIRTGLQTQYSLMMQQAAKAVQDYTDATLVEFMPKLEDSSIFATAGWDKEAQVKKAQEKWLNKQLSGETDKVKTDVLAKLRKGDLVAPPLSLAACVEAVALLGVGLKAHEHKQEREAETLASVLLERGLKAAKTITKSDGTQVQSLEVIL